MQHGGKTVKYLHDGIFSGFSVTCIFRMVEKLTYYDKLFVSG